MNKETIRALEADGEKLRQLTDEDHGPYWLEECDVCNGSGIEEVYAGHGNVNEIPCSMCSGKGVKT